MAEPDQQPEQSSPEDDRAQQTDLALQQKGLKTPRSDPQERYDVFLVHCSQDNETAHQINTALQQKGFKTFAHFKNGVEFPAGRSVFDNILYAVNASKIILILLTKQALRSQWVTFEVLMGLEKSHREESMCVRLVFEGISEKERTEFKKGTYHWIPDVILDFNKDSWLDDLAAKLREEVSMRELLPAGNVAHGLVFNYYVGFLQYVLPALSSHVSDSEYNKEGTFSKKFFIIIPESCIISPLEGSHDDFVIEKMKNPLNMDIKHGDKNRTYSPSVYKISRDGSEKSYYFSADTPFILATMSKMKEMGFAEIELHLQVVRFKMTLMELVQHRENKGCRDTAKFVPYHDPEESPARAIWDAVVEEFTVKETKAKANIATKKAHMKAEGEEFTATITHLVDIEEDHTAAVEIQEFLEKKGVDFRNGDSKTVFQALEDARWNIFILSEKAVEDDTMTIQFQAALECSITDNEVQVIPVLAKGSDITKIPYNYKWATLLKQDEPEYFNKLWNTMQKRRKMLELLPSGVVYEGLSYAYVINYIPFTTVQGKDFRQRFTEAKEKYDVKCPCVPKMFVIVPKSCSFPPPGSNFTNEEHLGPLEPVVIGFRKYFLQLYRLTMKTGEKVCYAREYATPAIALHDMARLPFAGLTKEAMNDQAKQFADFSERIIKDPMFNEKVGDVKNKCEMVYFDDEELGMDGVTTVLEERLAKNLTDGNFV